VSDLTADDIIQSVKANSEQINGDDLIAGTITGRIVRVTKGTTEQPVFVYLDTVQGKSFRPCKSERRIMIEMWGEDPSAWKGQAVRLHRDPSAKWEGKPVGGVRIEAATIARPLVTSSTVSRGKKQARTIGVLQVQEAKKPPTAQAVADKLRTKGLLDGALEAFGDNLDGWDVPRVIEWAQGQTGGGGA